MRTFLRILEIGAIALGAFFLGYLIFLMNVIM